MGLTFPRTVMPFRTFARALQTRASVKLDVLNLDRLNGNRDGIVVLGINRPKEKNSLCKEMVEAFNSHLGALAEDRGARVLILRSLVPRVFCAGADLKERASLPEAEVGPLVASFRNFMQRLYNLPIPTVAALDGAAYGGGLELALACDLRVASKSAKMGLVETKLAIIPGAGGTQRLPRLIGRAFAKELMFTGRVIDGEEAAHYGLVNHAVEQNDVGDAAYQRALHLAEEILPQGPIALTMVKHAIDYGMDTDIKSGLDIEKMCYAKVIPTKDRLEGLEAFIQKRPPKYQGH